MGFFDFFKSKPPAKPAMKERRLLPRWKVSAPATLTFEADAPVVPCVLLDLNFKGFAVSTDLPLPEDRTLLKLDVNGRYPYNVEVALIWHFEKDAKHYYGFFFVRLRDADRQKMFAMMRTDFPQFNKI